MSVIQKTQSKEVTEFETNDVILALASDTSAISVTLEKGIERTRRWRRWKERNKRRAAAGRKGTRK